MPQSLCDGRLRYNSDMPSPTTSHVDLSTPIQFLKGGGPERALRLAKLGLTTLKDLLFYFPRDYEDLTDLRTIDKFEEGVTVSTRAVVEEIDMRDRPGGGCIIGMLLKQDSNYLRAVWFNQPFIKDRFRLGQTLLLAGKPRLKGRWWEMAHPQARAVEADDSGPTLQLLPVYPLTEGIQQRHLRRLIGAAVDACVDAVDDVFSADYLAEHALLPIREALRQIHFPADRAQLAAARRRLVYQELLVMQLALALRQQASASGPPALAFEPSTKIDARIRRLFPFTLTAAQDEVIREIALDMGSTRPMNRLLQGDVGSGKTVVAVYAMLLAVAHGAQAALMAPTEILARQHADTIGKMLEKSKVEIALLLGNQSQRERDAVLAGLRSGQIQIVIGTQALLDNRIEFARLGLIVIDEQHRFGVRQRALLKQSAASPHYLVMTATPIPRTVAMTQFGDLSVSTLRDSPAGRQPVHTYLAGPDQRERWWEFFRRKLREGRQGYVIAPLVEGSSETQVVSIEQSFEELANGELEAFRLALVHGRMETDAKLAAMEAFRSGKAQVLVATSLVEVGVDVPNATLMTIESAERFGLAQLHQLRGRISRGAWPAYCCLFADVQTPEATKRLEAMLESTSGFELAEIDFALRGPGDVLGTRQHGMPPLMIADLARDGELLAEARRDAQALLKRDPQLANPQFGALRRMSLRRYGKVLELADVG